MAVRNYSSVKGVMVFRSDRRSQHTSAGYAAIIN